MYIQFLFASLISIISWQPSPLQIQQILEENLASTNAKVSFNKGLAFARAGDWDRAILEYDRAIKLDPFGAEAYNHRGSAYFFKGDKQKAIADYTQAIQLDPKHAVALTNRGKVRRAMGDHKGAIADLTKAIEIEPCSAAAYKSRGNVRRAMGDHKGAVADLTKAIEIEPYSAAAYNERAVAYFFWKKDIRALNDFRRAIKLDPTYVQTYINRGSLYYSRNNSLAAIEDFTKAIDLDPTNMGAYSNRAMAYQERYLSYVKFGVRSSGTNDYKGMEMCNSDIEKVQELYWGKILRSDSTSARQSYRHLNELFRKRDYDGAISTLSELIVQFSPDPPNNPESEGDLWNTGRRQILQDLYSRRADAHYGKDDYDSAIADITQAIDFSPPGTSALYLTRSRAYSAKREHEKAKEDLKRAGELRKSKVMKFPLDGLGVVVTSQTFGLVILPSRSVFNKNFPDWRNNV